MNSEVIRYHCQNCGERFSLTGGQSIRCPSCFWTTSIQRVDPGQKETPSQSRTETLKKPPKQKISLPVRKIAIFLGFLFVIALLYMGRDKLPFKRFAPQPQLKNIPAANQKKTPSPPKNANDLPENPLALLSEEERSVLSNKVILSIPRPFTPDEKEILNRHVDFSALTLTPPNFKFWTLDEFKTFLVGEQRKRKIHFPGSYEHPLVKLFEAHYLKAEEVLKSGKHEEARTELLKALAFPVYANNIRLHRSVALVMLQGYINDVLGKIQKLNSYILTEALANSLNRLKMDYETFFILVQSEDWEKALPSIHQLDQEAKQVETQIRSLDVRYPPEIAEIDPDIQKGLAMSGEPLSPALTELNSVQIDLKIKKKQIEQNMNQNLQVMKDKYETALSAIQIKRWEDAKSALESVNYPPELADDAKRKSAILATLTEKAKK